METPCSRLLNFNLLPEPLPWEFRIRQTDKPSRRPAQPQSGELRFGGGGAKGRRIEARPDFNWRLYRA
jgi:hypothetical protein